MASPCTTTPRSSARPSSSAWAGPSPRSRNAPGARSSSTRRSSRVPTTPAGPSRTPSPSSTSGASACRASTTAWSILYDLSDPCHGQVQLYAAPGYAAAFLSNAERQEVFQQRMLPFLRGCDFDGATLAAMDRIDETATADHAATLQLARQVDAAAGLDAWHRCCSSAWWPGPAGAGCDSGVIRCTSTAPRSHAGPTAGADSAAAAVVIDGRTTRHALTTALVTLRPRGERPFPRSDETRASRDSTSRCRTSATRGCHATAATPSGRPRRTRSTASTARRSHPHHRGRDVPRVREGVAGFDDRLEAGGR